MKERLLFLFIDIAQMLLSRQLDKLRGNNNYDRLERFSAFADKRMQKRDPDGSSLTDTDTP